MTATQYLQANTVPEVDGLGVQYLQANLVPVPDPDTAELYLQCATTDYEPRPLLFSSDPSSALTMGGSAVLSGYNFNGNDDGHDMQPEVRFYELADVSAWYEECTVVEWDYSSSPGTTMDEVSIVVPSILPASGFFLIIHTGTDKNPTRAYSNFLSVTVNTDVPPLDYIDFDSDDLWLTAGAGFDSYFIGAAALDGQLYVTSKRRSAFKFDGDAVTILDKSDFGLAGGTLDNEIQHVYNGATSGTFTLTVEGIESAAIAYNAAASAVKSALEALSNVTAVTVTGAGVSSDPWIVEFTDPGGIDVDTMIAGDSSLTGGTTTVSTSQSGGDETLPDESFPMAHFAVQKHDRMWVANVLYADNTSHKSRVHWSSLLKPELWYGTDYLDFDPDDGQEVTGMVSYGEAMIVFKDRSVHMLTGSSESSFARIMLDPEIGTVSPYTIEVDAGNLLFFDRDAGVWMFDGASFSAVSDPIRTYLLDGINYETAYKSSAFIHLGKYYLSVPWGSSLYPSRTFVFDTKTKSWSEYDYGIRDALSVGGRVYGVAAREADGVFRMLTGDSDNTVDIDATVETPWVAPGGHSMKQRMRNVDAAFSNLGGAVKVDLLTDFDNATVQATQSVTVSDPTADQVLQRISGLGGRRWRSSQLRFSNVAGSDFQLNRLTLLWSGSRRNRGVED